MRPQSDVRWKPMLAREEFFVFGVRTDPEPRDFVAAMRADRTVTAADPGGVNWKRGMNPLEPKPRVRWIRQKAPVSLTRVILNWLRHPGKETAKTRGRAGFQSLSGSSSTVRPARCSAMASAAILSRRGQRSDRGVIAWRSRLSSSASTQSAAASCSFSANLEHRDGLFELRRHRTVILPPGRHGRPP